MEEADTYDCYISTAAPESDWPKQIAPFDKAIPYVDCVLIFYSA